MNLNINILIVATILSIFLCLGCVAAAEDVSVSDNAQHNSILTMPVSVNSGTGYHWEVSPDTYGVTLMTANKYVKPPKEFGSTETTFYTFLIQNPDDYYVKLVLYDPSGNIVDEKIA